MRIGVFVFKVFNAANNDGDKPEERMQSQTPVSFWQITASVYLKTGAVEYTNRNRGEYSKSNLPSLYHVIRSVDSI